MFWASCACCRCSGRWNDYLEGYFRYDVEELPTGTVRSKAARHAIEEELGNLERERLWVYHHQIKAPTLIFRAPDGLLTPTDCLMTQAEAAALAHAIPRSKLVVVPGTNHYTVLLGSTGMALGPPSRGRRTTAPSFHPPHHPFRGPRRGRPRHLDVAPPLKSIIGPNGAGKTTLFNLLSGQYRASGGRIAFKGEDITGWSAARRTRAGIGRSFQLTNIFPTLSVLENVRVALQARAGLIWNAWRSYRSFPELEDRAWEILETVLLSAKWRAPAGELAHGEKRKLEVGILLALDAQVLLLDEPTAGMSLEEVPSIIALIEAIRRRRDRTVLLVEHKIDMIMALSDSIAVLKDGRLIADDNPEAISRNAEVQAAYFGGGVR
jgi:branched-chain amino acid transport system ATP-binding protein